MKKHFRSLTVLIAISVLTSCTGPAGPDHDAVNNFTLTLQKRNEEGLIRIDTIHLKASRAAIVVMDMWDRHWCGSFTRKTEAMIEPMNRTLGAARQLGVCIVFSPSGVTGFYEDHAQRKAMIGLPLHVMPENPFNPPQPPWKATGGCECGPDRPCNAASGAVWTRQHKELERRRIHSPLG